MYNAGNSKLWHILKPGRISLVLTNFLRSTGLFSCIMNLSPQEVLICHRGISYLLYLKPIFILWRGSWCLITKTVFVLIRFFLLVWRFFCKKKFVFFLKDHPYFQKFFIVCSVQMFFVKDLIFFVNFAPFCEDCRCSDKLFLSHAKIIFALAGTVIFYFFWKGFLSLAQIFFVMLRWFSLSMEISFNNLLK